MKITAVRITPAGIPITMPLLHSWGVHPGFGRIIVEIDTDEGITGLGECSLSPSRAQEEVLKAFVPLLIGEDPFNIERIKVKLAAPFYVRMFGNTITTGFAAVEFALLDITGKALGVPVYTLLGGKMKDHVNFSGYVFYPAGYDEWERTDAALIDHVRALVEEKGFTSVKFKCGVFHPNKEIATFRHIREAFPELPIRMDPNSIWSVATAVRVARKLVELDPEYLEDPTWGMAGMARVKRMSPNIPLASNMAVFGYEDIAPGLLLDAVDVILADIHWYGGLRGVRELAKLCETLGLDCGMHSGTEFGISMAAMLHVNASISSMSHQADSHYHYLTDDVITEPFTFSEGAISVPDAPGLGVELDQDKLARYHELYEMVIGAASAMETISGGALAVKPRF
ncbi:MAG: enolase C-terminal domain-like protein [Actinomycetota bacterium]